MPNQLACVDINGNMQNEHKPSSELKMHLNIYRQRNDVKAIVHAHPVFATAYAVCGKPLDKKYITEAVVSLGEVPVTQFALPSSQDLADSCNPYIQDYQALLLANHGALTWDRTLEAALFKLETIEQLAKISFLAEAMHAKELTLQQVNKLIALRAVYDL